MDVGGGNRRCSCWIVRGLCVYARVTLHSLFRRKNSTAAIDVSLKANLFISDVQSPRHVT